MALPGETQMKSGEETLKALPGKIQMISGGGELFYSKAETFVGELKKYSAASDNYTIVSIIGPQGSGKSYLLNTLFSTEFDVLNAKKGRKQTTKGIWIAKCNDPCMIILDVEGCDGRERGENDTLFEKQSALFSLALSDVLLLNMWYKDTDRQDGGSYGLIKLIFEQRAKIEAPKTTIIILVRDYDYETPLDITKKDLKERMNELWHQVHPASKGLKMSDYIKVKVKDFPNKSQEQEFTQKSKDLAKFLCNYAASGSPEQKHCASSFAYSSQIIWDKVRKNKRLSAADHKLAMATYFCSQIKNEILESFDEDTGYRSLTSGTSMSVEQFNTKLLSFLNSIFSRYEEDTRAHDRNTMDKVKLELKEETLKRLEPIFKDKIVRLTAEMLSLAKSKVHHKLNNLQVLNDGSKSDVINAYMTKFDKSRGEVNLFSEVLEKQRKELENDLKRIVQEEEHKIQTKRETRQSKTKLATNLLMYLGPFAIPIIKLSGMNIVGGVIKPKEEVEPEEEFEQEEEIEPKEEVEPEEEFEQEEEIETKEEVEPEEEFEQEEESEQEEEFEP